MAETDSDHAAQLYELTQEMTGAAGLPAYEISNHARAGEESRHNLTYWRYGTYVGVGPGAHGRRGGLATQRHRKPENWLGALARNGHGICEETPIAPTEAAVEALLMGLRLRDGVELGRIADLAGRPPDAIIDERALARLERGGLLTRCDERLAVTPSGMLLLDRILAELVRA
jgi:oxygen-independent coproporphyrinogen-3 oxidase